MTTEEIKIDLLNKQVANHNRRLTLMEELLKQHLVFKGFCPHKKKTKLDDY